jgi:hypothetical protein
LRNCILGELEDQGAAALVNLLASMSTLQLLKLNRCFSITTNGWREFAQLLQNGSKVKTLELIGDNLNEEVVIDFATALANNSSLSKLQICGSKIACVALLLLSSSLLPSIQSLPLLPSSTMPLH